MFTGEIERSLGKNITFLGVSTHGESETQRVYPLMERATFRFSVRPCLNNRELAFVISPAISPATQGEGLTMLRRSRIALAAVALSVTTLAFAAHAKLVSVDKGTVTVKGVAKPALGEFTGTVKGVTAKEEGDKIVFLANLTLGLDMGLRDSHTREAFKIKKKKEEQASEGSDDTRIKLSIDKDKLKMPADGAKDEEGSVPAKLTLNGKTIDIPKVAYTVSRTGSDIHIKKASFTFDYTKLGVAQIKQMGLRVEPTVTVTLKGMKLRDK